MKRFLTIQDANKDMEAADSERRMSTVRDYFLTALFGLVVAYFVLVVLEKVLDVVQAYALFGACL